MSLSFFVICIVFAASQENHKPSEIFCAHYAKFCEICTSADNLQRVTNSLFTMELIGYHMVQFTFTDGLLNHHKASKIASELYCQLKYHNDPKLYLNKMCKVLLEQEDPSLKDLAENILAKL